MTSSGRYRWRTRLRRLLPWCVVERGFAGKGTRDCGAHEWYNQDGRVARCYHCEAGERPWAGASDRGGPGRGPGEAPARRTV